MPAVESVKRNALSREVEEQREIQPKRRRIINRALWTVQGLLALLFLFTGVTKLILPLAVLTAQEPLPGLFVRFLGVCEVLGALGLILPGLLRIRPVLTPLAAMGLVVIMIGATVLTILWDGFVPALMPLVAGLLAIFVAYGRILLAPISDRASVRARRTTSARA